MAHIKSKCLYCDGKGKVVILGDKARCPWCYPPPGHIHAEYCDAFTKLTTYGKDGKVKKVEELKHKTRRANNANQEENRDQEG